MRQDLMVQQQVEDSWQHMVGVICLNQVDRRQTKPVLKEFFERWPTAGFLLYATVDEIAEVLQPLGMQNVRAKRIYKMTQQWLYEWDGEDATQLCGIGKYGSDSYRIFYKNDIPSDVEDKELKRYIEEEVYAI